jgi:pimeloyl-ACP methyl ester carboxylesterase
MQSLPVVLIFLLMISSSCQQADESDNTEQPFGNNPSTGKYYDIRGFKMYCETYGEGEPLLLIHGNGGSIKQFASQIPYFSKKYKVIAADSRSQGKSNDNGDTLTYEMMADDYAALLDAMKIDSAYVIGWSDGGINGLLLSSRHPQKVKKLASTGANLWSDSTSLYEDFIDLVQPSYVSLKEKANKTDEEKNEWKLTRLILEEPNIELSEINKIQCPALIIGGDHDVIKEEHTMLIFKNIPKAYLWILPNSGHSTLITYKDQFNKVVDDFLSNPYRELTGKERFD